MGGEEDRGGCGNLRHSPRWFGPLDRTYFLPRLFSAWARSPRRAGWCAASGEFSKSARATGGDSGSRPPPPGFGGAVAGADRDQFGAAILTLNGGGQVIQANEAASRLLGTEKGVSGQNLGHYLPALRQVPSDQSAPVFRTTMECNARRQNGEVFLAKVCFSTYAFSGEPRLTAVATENELSVNDLRRRSGSHGSINRPGADGCCEGSSKGSPTRERGGN